MKKEKARKIGKHENKRCRKREDNGFWQFVERAPVKYFETKFERPVLLDEFVAAVVPKDIHPELRKALEDKGLAIEEYDRGDESSRLEAVRRASDRDDVQFSVKRSEETGDEYEVKGEQKQSIEKENRKFNEDLEPKADCSILLQ